MRRRCSWLAAAGVVALAAGAPGQAMPDPAKAHRDSAGKALLRGDGIAAEAELKRASASGASKPELAAAMGEALIDQGELERARGWLAPGQFAPDQAAYGWRMLGLLERMGGNLDAAAKAFDHGLAAAPQDPLLWVEIGRMRYLSGAQLQAGDAAQRALAAAPDNPRALEFKAELVRDAQGYVAALPLYEAALEQLPDDLTLLGGYGEALGEAGRAAEMLAVTRHMLALSPRNPKAFFLQAVLAARAGNVGLARAMLGRTGGKLNAQAAGLLLAGLLELEAGNANVAAEQLAALAGSQPANQRVQLLLARALYLSGDYAQLFARFGGLVQRGDASPYLLTVLGRAYEDQGNRTAAASLLDRAAGTGTQPLMPLPEADAPGVLGPRWSADQAARGTAVPYVRSLLGTGDTIGAERVAGRYAQLRPGSGEALGLIGDVELLTGAPARALHHYVLASQVRFGDLLLLRVGAAYDRMGQSAAVQPLLAHYVSVFPGSRLAVRMAAQQAAMAGQWEIARLLLENLRARAGNRDYRLLADLSFVQLHVRDTSAAQDSAERAWQLQPASPICAQALGMALAATGTDAARARQLLQLARQTGGDNPLVRDALAKLH